MAPSGGPPQVLIRMDGDVAGSGFPERENGMVRAPSGCNVRATMSTKAAHSVVFGVVRRGCSMSIDSLSVVAKLNMV